MANVTKRIENDTLYFELAGRVDTSNANQVEQAIQNIKSENSASNYIVDAAQLEFISSAGLRVLLATQKSMGKKGKMIVKEVNDTVMEIFNITGFLDILTIE